MRLLREVLRSPLVDALREQERRVGLLERQDVPDDLLARIAELERKVKELGG